MEERIVDEPGNNNQQNAQNDLINENEERARLIQTKKPEEKKSKASLLNIFQNLEKDLILKNDCEKEFDLEDFERNENRYEKVEVFGNPRCYICLSGNLQDSSIQLFNCSHCNKLFCKNCLSIHYKATYKNIEDSYSKYIKDENEDIIDQDLPQDAGNCRKFFYLILIFLFNFIYLLPIFAMKPIIGTLETIIYNSIAEVLTYKVEDPNSLFNYYEIFFDKINTLNLSFDLMMIMNWFGDRLLDCCRFIPTCIFFMIINFGYFVMLFNFDFLEYTENNKYSIWKFLHLIACYLILFIGMGGSSLLSQKLFIEFFNKYKGKKNKNDNINNNRQRNEDNTRIVTNSINDVDQIIEEHDNNNEEHKENNEQNDILVNDAINIENQSNNNNENNNDNNNSNISAGRNRGRETLRKQDMKNIQQESKMSSFFLITLITLLSFFINFYINLLILNWKSDKDDKIFNEYNITNYTSAYDKNHNLTNSNITLLLYDSNKKFFFDIYVFYYIVCMVASILFYSMLFCFCLRDTSKKKYQKKQNQIVENPQINDDVTRITSLDQNTLKQIKEDKTTNSYSMCKCCGFFYFSSRANTRGKHNCFIKFCLWLQDLCVLNWKSLFDCCDITICYIFNIIFCCGSERCNCKCNCCEICQKINYNKTSEDFCFCFQEKRKFKWLHDYITSDVQKDVAPYVFEYFLMGLIIISFQEKFVDFKVKVPKFEFDDEFSFEDGLKLINDWKTVIIIILSLILFFLFTKKLSQAQLKNIKGKKNYLESYSIFNGIHIILLINSWLSLIFSILSFLDITGFNDYILIPILLYQYFEFSLNYYCIIVTEKHDDRELLLDGGVLVSIYLKIYSIVYSFIQDYEIEQKYIFIFQIGLSGIIIIYFTFYLIFSKYKYVICYNCVNVNFCGFWQVCGPCCKYNTFCLEGVQYCYCCCCDLESKCYNPKCDPYFVCCACCTCFAENNDEVEN